MPTAVLPAVYMIRTPSTTRKENSIERADDRAMNRTTQREAAMRRYTASWQYLPVDQGCKLRGAVQPSTKDATTSGGRRARGCRRPRLPLAHHGLN